LLNATDNVFDIIREIVNVLTDSKVKTINAFKYGKKWHYLMSSVS